ncbi:unnamed protein product [Sphacelaria rigidula]
MLDELQSIKDHQVADTIPTGSVPPNNNIIGTRWVFKVKADGHFKARLVVQGWAQRHGLDCGSTFAPCLPARKPTIATGNCHCKTNWPILALDVQTAFLNGKLQETVYIMLTPFVDDKLMPGPSINVLHQVQNLLETNFSISELGPVSLILGMEVIRDEARGTQKLSQHNCVKSLLLKFGMESSHPIHTPGTPDQLVEDTPEDNFLGAVGQNEVPSHGREPHLFGAEHKIRHCI